MTRRMVLLVIVVVLGLLAGTATASTATYTVDSTADAPLATPGATTCESTEVTTADPSGTCTLRAAVQAADNAGGANTISLPAGTYQLAIPSNSADDPSNGDLDVTNAGAVAATAITITGAGSNTTAVDANHIDRAFAVDSGASLTLGGVTVRDGAPSASSSGLQNGGTIYSAGALTLINDAFTANSAAAAGASGGVVDQTGSDPLTVNNTTFTDNSAAASGGAIADSGNGTLRLDGDEFDRNQTVGSGGAIDSQAPVTSTGSTFVANIAAGSGGAIDQAGPLTLTDGTLSGNEAGAGGGLAASTASINLINDTVTGNSVPAGANGGGLALSRGPTPGVVNTIIAQNTGGDCQSSLSSLDAGHNLDSDGSCVTAAPGDATSPDPRLGAPSSNGGPVRTDAELVGSPAIDTGTNSGCPGADARGVVRPQGNACDIGAYEFVPPPTPPATSTTTVTSPGTTTTNTVTTTSSTPGPGPGTKPIATTRGVLGARSTSAFLGGTVNAHNQPTSYMFQVGTTRSYGLATVTGHTDVAVLSVDTLIQRLKPSTLYHYRLVASNTAGTSYGADRTFRTARAYDGSVKLGATTLTVHAGKVSVPLTCASTKACVLRFSITISARLAKTHKLGTLSFTRSTNTLVSVRAHRTARVSAAVNPAALALLAKAAHHRLAGKLSTRPRTDQLGLISTVTLALK